MAFHSKAFDWTLQEGEDAGQTIPHLHIHILPRKLNDLPEPGDWYPQLAANQTNLIDSFLRPHHSPEEMEIIVSQLKRIYLQQNPA